MSRNEIEKLQEEISILEENLRIKRRRLKELKETKSSYTAGQLTKDEIVKYSRQIIMPQLRVEGQIALKNSKVLIVGVGGLGCPAAMYLAAAGIGEIHIMDYDEIDISNLHRQILHHEFDVGRVKVESAKDKLQMMNSNIHVVAHHIQASSSIIEIVKSENFNVILDCSDNAPTRYLLNDICVIYNIPLVSGSALQMEGQLTVYHYRNGPCYRCLFPTPPPPHTVTNCGDGGVLGPVAGAVGVLQALETIKIITNIDGVLTGRLLLLDGCDGVFRNVKLRSRVASCEVCGDEPRILAPIDYEQFCGSKAHDKVVDINILPDAENASVERLQQLLTENIIVLDVRPELEYAMCKLPKTVNVPFSEIESGRGWKKLENIIHNYSNEAGSNVYVLCRRGNDSQRAVVRLKEKFTGLLVNFVNIRGGLHAYSKYVDDSFPVY